VVKHLLGAGASMKGTLRRLAGEGTIDDAAVKRSVSRGDPIDGADEEGKTALMIAAKRGDAGNVRALLRGGAAVDLRDQSEETALLIAAEEGHEEIVRLLAEGGAELDARDAAGWTAAARLAKQKAIDTVKWLGKRGAGLEGTLLGAGASGDVAVIKACLALGGDPAASDADSWTPAMHAASAGELEALKLILKKGGSVKGCAIAAANAETTATLAHGLTLGEPVDGRNPVGQTPLMIAAESDHADSIELLIERGAGLDLQDNDGWTALIYAARRESASVARALLDHGAQKGIRDHEGRTALDHVHQFGDRDLKQLLMP
jgi:uncharacterized protein